jgi:hypothetical protein
MDRQSDRCPCRHPSTGHKWWFQTYEFGYEKADIKANRSAATEVTKIRFGTNRLIGISDAVIKVILEAALKLVSAVRPPAAPSD